MTKRERNYVLPLEVREAVAGALRLVRVERKLSQDDLAALLGLTQQAIDKAEKADLGAKVARKVYAHLDATEEQLVKRAQRGDYTKVMAAVDKPASRTRRAPASSTAVLPEPRRLALEAEDWDGVRPGEYEMVHLAIASERFQSGIEPPTSYWRAQIKQHRAEFTGKRERDVVTGDPDAPDSTVEAEKARRRAGRRT